MTAGATTLLVSARWLRPLRVGWMVAFAITLVMVAAACPVMYSQAHEACTQTPCNGPQLTPAQLRSLLQLGLSLDQYSAFYVGLTVSFVLVYSATACLIFVRRSRERMALLSAYFLLVFGGLTFSGIPDALATELPILRVPAGIITLAGAALLVLFFFLFPNGRFVPRWAPWLVPVLPVVQAPDALAPGSPYGLDRLPTVVALVALCGILAFILGSQVYRFQRVSNAVERQQTKWVVLGVGMGLGGFLAYVAIGAFVSSSLGRGLLVVSIANTVMYLLMMLIPLSIALAILRYHLWETDLLINRTLVYGSLTVSLAGLYILGVLGLQAIFRAVTGQGSDLAVAIVTLAVAALFNPWRNRLQRFIDRRFYRRRYDAAHTLTGFNARLRDEVNLDQLAADLLAVTHDAIQPTGVGLWLRGTDRNT